MSEKEKSLFETTDPRGYCISLSHAQYYNHIVSPVDHTPHNEFTPEEIKDCVENPDLIYQSESIPDRDLYYGKVSATYPELYLKTVVAVDDQEKTGEIVTAYLAKHLSGGKELKYVNCKSEL